MTNASSSEGRKYSAFLSYSHQDERWGRWLQRALETYRVPSRLVGRTTTSGVITRRLGPIFRDRSDLPTATDLGATITEALRASANLIVICSPNSATSRWVNEEIRVFRALGRGHRIFCLIVDGEPHASDKPGREVDDCFAPALRFIESADGQPTGQRAEPIAADARPGADGRTNAKLKIVAGLLDVGLDELKQREQRRRYQRLAVVAGLALVVMFVTTGLAIEAQIARRAAEQRRKAAESLVDFMLADLNDKLRQVQRLDILEAVDNQAMAYFLAQPIAEMTDQTLALRAKALLKIGNVREDQGNLPAAMESYAAASDVAAELVRRNPGDPDLEAAYAETLNHTGNAYWYQGDLDHALECFQRAVAMLEAATGKRASSDWLFALSSARTNAGRVLEARGDFAAAKPLYEAVLATSQRQAAREPNDTRWQTNVADADDSLGKLALQQGQLAQAVAAYRDVQQAKEGLWRQDPANRDVQESLLLSEAILGRTLALCGADEVAASYVRSAVTRASALVAFDATQADWRMELGKYSALLGGLERRAGRLEEAADRNRDALRVLQELTVTDATNSSWRRELASARVEAGRLQLAVGDFAEAGRLLDAALTTITSERAGNPQDRGLRLLEAQARIVQGRVAMQRDHVVAARDHWTQARDVVAPAAQVGADPNFLAAWAGSLLLLGDAKHAAPVLARLATMGFRTPDFEALAAAAGQAYRVDPSVPQCSVDVSGVNGDAPVK